jgi:hypothetical protein
MRAHANEPGKNRPSPALPSFLGLKLSNLIGTRFETGAHHAPSLPLRSVQANTPRHLIEFR